MITQEQYNRIAHVLPVLRRASSELVREFQQTAYFARIPSGKDVFVEGNRADAIALLISGVVRVYKIGETGREITLYRFGIGESCILTANAILSQQSFPDFRPGILWNRPDGLENFLTNVTTMLFDLLLTHGAYLGKRRVTATLYRNMPFFTHY